MNSNIQSTWNEKSAQMQMCEVEYPGPINMSI